MSVQNPNDSDAEYRSKTGKQVKSYSTNITETCDEKDKPNLITHIDIKGATTADNTYVESGVKGSEEVTGGKVDTLNSDGAPTRARRTINLSRRTVSTSSPTVSGESPNVSTLN